MVRDQGTDGQDSGQEDSSSEGSTGNTQGGQSDDRVAKLEAQLELLNGNFSELRQALVESRRPAAAAEVEVDDDDAPLTPSKVRKIVQSSVAQAASATQGLNERQRWDQKAKEEFPLNDPQFLLKFKQEWKEQTESGLDPRHPRAVYNVAKLVARSTGAKKAPAKDADTAHTAEASTSQPSRQSSHRAGRLVSEDDPRLRFYAMKGNRSKEQMEGMRKKLSEKDSKRASR
jgi:hypothetical protein